MKNKVTDYLESKTLNESLEVINQDLLTYFEGISISRVKYILDNFKREALETNSIVSIKES